MQIERMARGIARWGTGFVLVLLIVVVFALGMGGCAASSCARQPTARQADENACKDLKQTIAPF